MNALSEQMLTPNGAGTHLWATEIALGTAAAHRRFTIAGGPILLLALWGIVKTTAMSVDAAILRIEHSLGTTNLCGDLAVIASDPVGTVYYMEGVQASLLVKGENGNGTGSPATSVAVLTPIPLIAGDIDITVGTNPQTGVVEWHIVYKELDPLSTVVVAVYD